MKIVVCLKQVPRESAASGWSIHPNRERVSGIINPYDRRAIKGALDIRKGDDEIIALSMGPPNTRESLLETLAMGVDRAILLSDPRFAEADTLATSYALSCAIGKIGDVDLVLCGSRTVDSETGHVGPQLAEFLEFPLLSYVNHLTLDGRTIVAERVCDRYRELLTAQLPALATYSHRHPVRAYATLAGLRKAFDEDAVTIWDANDISAEMSLIGKAGSPTLVKRILTPEKQRTVTMIHDKRTDETITMLLKLLRERNILLLDKVRARRGFEGFDL